MTTPQLADIRAGLGMMIQRCELQRASVPFGSGAGYTQAK